jgi:N-acetylmuramic acid 6-phosphate etherase
LFQSSFKRPPFLSFENVAVGEIFFAMKAHGQSHPATVLLGIEAGGTRTVAAALNGCDAASPSKTWRRMEFGPANLRLLSDAELSERLAEIARAMPQPGSLAIGMAGARTESDRRRIRTAAARVWPDVPCYATNDLETALMAGTSDGHANTQAEVLVLSGTGSCCYGRTATGRTAKVGGWGHVLGDKGSGYEIGLRGIKASVYHYDRSGAWPALGQRILRALQLNEPDELIAWAQIAGKDEIARLALEVFAAAAKKDKIARDILDAAANSLAKDAAACAGRLVKIGAQVRFILAGGVLLQQPAFRKQVGALLKERWPNLELAQLQREGVWGALELARRNRGDNTSMELESRPVAASRESAANWDVKPARKHDLSGRDARDPRLESNAPFPAPLATSPTEQRNPRSVNLDRMPLREAIALMFREDEKIPAAILRESSKLERVIRLIVRAFKQGGRLFYVGAGTSGRLGVLDASECPPTFRTEPEMVQAIMAGGQRAIWEAVEGAEDDPGAGARAVAFRGVGRRDVVIGIAASGRTPFVWGALEEARRRGATTVLLCFNPNLEIAPKARPDIVIAPNVGPEILTGSTRLKAGTATKLILNMFTTLTMAQLGKVRSNLMIDVKASNTKLRDRATRIVQELTEADYASARAALETAGWKISGACERLRGRPIRRTPKS